MLKLLLETFLMKPRLTSLPVPRLTDMPVARFQQMASHRRSISNYEPFIPHPMSLSSNIWGMRPLLCSAFFEPDVECNLVSTWLHPAFTVIDPLSEDGNLTQLAAVLGRRQTKLAALWLGAIIMGLARTELRDIRNGPPAINLPAAAWTGTVQSFITLKPGVANEHTIRCEDECRLLFITASDGHARVPIWPWKPFGQFRICDTDREVQQHAFCKCHCFEYQSWYWCLTDGELQDPGLRPALSVGKEPGTEMISTPFLNMPFDDFGQSLSEGATPGIFQWLRMSGYPAYDDESLPSLKYLGETINQWLEVLDREKG
ncbi:hypothetical protein BDV33DRAFT_164762 [Aspergillus novoparasiticus]|uniref:Uncharacterized protein n=1 Tax=Aspergillus novoparasiticus TaxID=986946 RepID=A0A5N6F5E5_9EURO|nr:hypothetical protein BDV33DRAFT_164762 [Aspergillus novoparasiticus]